MATAGCQLISALNGFSPLPASNTSGAGGGQACAVTMFDACDSCNAKQCHAEYQKCAAESTCDAQHAPQTGCLALLFCLFTKCGGDDKCLPSKCQPELDSVGGPNGPRMADVWAFTDCTVKNCLAPCGAGGMGPGPGPMTASTSTGAIGDCAHHVFVAPGPGSGNLGGLSGADDWCQMEAAKKKAPPLPGQTWRALLSTSQISAKQHVQITGRVCLAFGGAWVANGAADFWSAKHLLAINLFADGADAGGRHVWTGSTPAGALAGPNCNEWMASGMGTTGVVGSTDATDGEWAQAAAPKALPCNDGQPLLCVSAP